MNTRREIERTLVVCALSGLLGISACGVRSASDDNETIEGAKAALNVAKPSTRGLVRDGAGTPIARARVDVRAAGSSRIVACTTTARDGTFALEVRAGTYDLTVIPRSGFAPQAFPGQMIAKGTQLELIMIAIGPALVTVTGHVTDQNGQPLSVSVCGTDCIETDDSGAFTLTARSDLPLRIAGDLEVPIDPTQSAPLDIVIPMFNLDGTVLDQTGVPMANTGVMAPNCFTVISDQISGTSCLDGVQTDENGRFHFRSLPGDVTLQVSGDAGIYTTVSVAGDTDVILQVPPVRSLSGRIADRDGNPLVGDYLCFTHSGCASRYCSRDCSISDENGQYQFNLSEGTYDFVLTSPPSATLPIGYYGLSQTITLTQSTVLDLPFANRTITGTVLNVDGTPAPNVPVAVSCHDIDVSGFVGRACNVPTTTDASGRFQLIVPGPGDVVLTATSSTVASLRVTVTDDTDVTLSLAPTPPATGQITNADGSPAAGFSVCYDPTGLSGSACTQTDSNGQYQLVLAPGPYSLSIFGNGPGISSIELTEPVTVSSAPTLIQLAPTRSVAIRLVNEDGTPLAGAEIFSICGSAPALSGGTERFCADPPASDASGLVTVMAPIGSPLELQIEPEPASSFRAVPVDSIAVSDATELTIAIQSTTSPH